MHNLGSLSRDITGSDSRQRNAPTDSSVGALMGFTIASGQLIGPYLNATIPAPVAVAVNGVL